MAVRSPPRFGPPYAGVAALVLLLGVAVAASPIPALALVAAAALAVVASFGLSAVLSTWMVSFFIAFYPVGNLLLKAGLILTLGSLAVTVAGDRSALRGRLRKVAPFAIPTVALLVWLAASVLWAPDSARAFSELWKFGISVGVFLMITTMVDSKRAIRTLIAAFIVGALITAVGALVGYQGGVVNSLPSEGRIQGGTGDPNVLAAAVIAAIALGAGLLKGTRRPTLRVALLATFFIFGITAAATGSRGGVVAAVAALLAALVVVRHERRAVVVLTVTMLIAGGAWLASSPSSIDRLTSFGDGGDGRGDLWRIAWEMFSAHPLQGVGLENFVPNAPNYVLHPGSLSFIHVIIEEPVVAHNTYLQFLAETGVVGLALFISVIAVSLTAALRAGIIYEKAGDLPFATLCRSVFVAAVALLSASFFISAAVDYKIWVVLGLGPAMLLMAIREDQSATRRKTEVVDSVGRPNSSATLTKPLRVAVIVPCYNDGATLEETLSSLRNQEPSEVVVVDDGSDDPMTLEVLGRVQSEGTLVVRQPNKGLAAARMLGLEVTQAPYVYPLDADDLLEPNSLEYMADELDADPALGAVWGDQRTFGELDSIQARTGDLDPWLITYINGLSAALVRREALKQVGGWVLKVGYEDWDLWMGLAEAGWRGRRIDRVTLCYRISSTRMLSGTRSHHPDLFEQMRRRHSPLFEARRKNRGRSSAPLRARVLLPLSEMLPMSELTRHRAQLAIVFPGHVLKVRWARLRSRPRL